MKHPRLSRACHVMSATLVALAGAALGCGTPGDGDAPLSDLGDAAVEAPLVDARGGDAGRGESGGPADDAAHETGRDASPSDAGVGAHDDFLPCVDQGWTGADVKTIENDVIKVGFKRSVGATITFAAEKSNMRNLVNDNQVSNARAGDPRVGTTFSDKGRQWQFGSDYFTPGNRWVVHGKNTGDYGFDTGGNVVQGGSLGDYYDESPILASAILDDPARGKVFCAKIRPRVWAVPGELGHIVLEEEIWLEGNAIAYKARHTVEKRDDTQTEWASREQENPCLYVIAPLTTHRAVVGEPFVGTPSVDRFPKDWTGSNSAFARTLLTSECWIGAYEGPGGKGVTYYSPMNSAVRNGQFGAASGDWSSNESSYLNAAPQMNYDVPGVYVDYGYVILGTEAEARKKIDTLPRPDPSFDFDFSRDNHRWFNGDCRVQRDASRALVVHLGDRNRDGAQNCTFTAPYRAWSASRISKLELTMAVTGTRRLELQWAHPGEAGYTNASKPFDVVGDGAMRTYVVSTDDAAWTGVISTVGIHAINDRSITPLDAQVVVQRIRAL